MLKKQCTKCGEEKSPSDYYAKSYPQGKRESCCKLCSSKHKKRSIAPVAKPPAGVTDNPFLWWTYVPPNPARNYDPYSNANRHGG